MVVRTLGNGVSRMLCMCLDLLLACPVSASGQHDNDNKNGFMDSPPSTSCTYRQCFTMCRTCCRNGPVAQMVAVVVLCKNSRSAVDRLLQYRGEAGV